MATKMKAVEALEAVGEENAGDAAEEGKRCENDWHQPVEAV